MYRLSRIRRLRAQISRVQLAVAPLHLLALEAAVGLEVPSWPR